MNVEPMLRRRPCREVGTGTERGRATKVGGGVPPPTYRATADLPSECNLILPTAICELNLFLS